MACPQQGNHDDCGVSALLFASQMGASADLHLIKAEHTMQLRYYVALCIIEAQLPGLLHAGSLGVSTTGSDQIPGSLSGASKPLLPFAAACSYIS